MKYILSYYLFFLAVQLSAQAAIHPSLPTAWNESDLAEVLIVLKEQPDTRLAKQLYRKAAKGKYVYELCRQLADQSQGRMRQLLDRNQLEYKPYLMVNAVWAKVDRQTAQLLAQMSEVDRIDPNPWYRQQLGQPTTEERAQGRASVTWGVERIGSTALWEMGYRGQGVVVGGQDTGYEWYHPALIDQYRGNQGDTVSHDYNWHDAIHEFNPLNSTEDNPCGLDSPEPCDDNNHGTHTMGTMIGDDGAGNQIGVAPDAQWMACRNMERGWGSPASYIECFEWFLAPTRVDGSAPDPTLAPHVIANSWSCPEVEGCFPENFALMQTAVDNLRAAGVVVVTSAGNSGPACSTVDTPPSILAGSFAVGATNDLDTIAGFSSRGPVMIDSSGRLKPQVVAPGVSVRSAVRDTAYAHFNGTSMAGPHVAGAVALLISARPELSGQVDLIETILQESARSLYTNQDCGEYAGQESPNAVYGYGIIDLQRALTVADQLLSDQLLTSSEAGLTLYPNPGDGLFTVQSEESAILMIELYDSWGRKLLHQAGQNGLVESLDLRHLPAGSYLVLAVHEKGRSVLRVQKN